MDSALAGLQLIFGSKVGYYPEDYSPYQLDTSLSPDYSVIKDAEGKILYVQDNIGVVESATGLSSFVIEEPGYVLGTAMITAYAISPATTNFIVQGIAALATVNDAFGSGAAFLVHKLSESLYSDSELDYGLRTSLVSFVGAHGEAVDPDGSLSSEVIWSDLPIYLFPSGINNTGDGADITFAYGSSITNAGAGEDLLFGFASAHIDGGADDDLLFAKNTAHAWGGAGGDILVGLENATVEGGEGDDWLFAFDDAKAFGDAGDDLLFGSNGAELYGAEGNDTIVAINSTGARIESGGDDDWIITSGGSSTYIDAGSGNDWIFSFDQQSEIHAGSGDDVIWTYGAGSTIDLGTGADEVYLGGFGQVQALGADDRIMLLPYIPLLGGLQFEGSESPWAVGYGGDSLRRQWRW